MSALSGKNIITKLKKIPTIIRSEGWGGITRRLRTRVFGDQYLKELQQRYAAYYQAHKPSEKVLESQREQQHSFTDRPLISIITPVFNTHHRFLKECIDSVLAQTYENWELLLVDDASTDLEIWTILEKYAAGDKRIRIRRRDRNGHICVASNDALKMAKGEWIALLDHDDYLWPNALWTVVETLNQHPYSEFIYSDEDKIEEDGHTHIEPFFKPDWSPHFLRSINYITHFTSIKRSLVDSLGGFTVGTEGAQDWDLFLRATSTLETRRPSHPWSTEQPIQHIPAILYSWRKSATSTSSAKHALAAKSYAYEAQERVLQADANQLGGGTVLQTKYTGVWKVLPKLKGAPLVSIIIPTKDNLSLLQPCIESILSLSTYSNIELCIVDTGSTDQAVWDYYDTLKERTTLQVIQYSDTFNYSAAVNLGAKQALGEYLLFLNDDTVLQTPDWIEQLLSYAQLPEVGAVSCRLLYPDGSIQHNGLVLGAEKGSVLGEKGFVSNYFRTARPEPNYGIASLMIDTVRDYSAVTAAALMINREKHTLIDGFDESLAIAFNDVDYCLNLQRNKLYNLVIPEVTLSHFESASLGKPGEQQRDLTVFRDEIKNMKKRWGRALEIDPYFRALRLENGKVYPPTPPARIAIEAQALTTSPHTGTARFLRNLIAPLLETSYDIVVYKEAHAFDASIDLFHQPYQLFNDQEVQLFSRYPKRILSLLDLILYHYPQYFPNAEAHQIYQRVTKKSIGQATMIHAISEANKHDLIQSLGVKPEKVRVIYPGIDFATFSEKPSIPLQLGDLSHSLLYVGSDFPHKNVLALVKGFLQYLEQTADLKTNLVLLLKSFPNGDLAAIQSLLAGSSHSGRVSIVSDYLDDATLSAYYHAALLHVNLSEYEGFGFTPLEAGAASLASLLYDNPTYRETMGKAAFYCDSLDPTAIADTLDHALKNSDELQNVGQQAQNRAKEFTWSRFSKELVQLYAEVLHSQI